MPKPTRKEIALANQLDALQRRYERRYEKQVYTALKKQLQPYLDAVEQAPANINQFDLISPAPLADVLESLYVTAGVAYAEAMYNAIQPPKKATKEQLRAGWRDFMRRFAVTNLTGVLIDINKTSKDIIERIVSNGLRDGKGIPDIARSIEQSVAGIFTSRAKLIARTEMVKATNTAAMQSAATSDFMYEKKWVPATDNRTRDDHLTMINKPYIPFEQPFIVGGYEMDRPGDGTTAPASQICNCRCKVVFRIMRDANGLPMRKLGSQSGAYTVTNGTRQVPVVQPADNLIANNLEDAKKISTNLINQNTPLVVNKTIFSDEMTLAKLNRYNQQINKLTKNYNLSPHLDNKSQITLSFESTEGTYGMVEAYSNRITKINFGHKASFEERIISRVDLSKGYPRYARKSKVDMENADISTLTHEFSHVISMKDDFAMFKYPQIQSFWDDMGKIRRRYRKEVKNLVLGKNYKELDDVYLGTYADTDMDEFMAEGFTEYQLSSNPSKYAKEIGQLIDKYFKK
jgi:hypothetical protein